MGGPFITFLPQGRKGRLTAAAMVPMMVDAMGLRRLQRRLLLLHTHIAAVSGHAVASEEVPAMF